MRLEAFSRSASDAHRVLPSESHKNLFSRNEPTTGVVTEEACPAEVCIPTEVGVPTVVYRVKPDTGADLQGQHKVNSTALDLPSVRM
jgi:hypothetical protein